VLGGLKNDGGFNQIGYDSVNALAKEGKITLDVKESVTNPTDAEPIFEQYAAQGEDLIIGWGLDFSDSVFKVAKDLPDTHFIATGSVDILDKATANVETWTYDTAQLGYLEGYVAGLSKLSPVGVVDGQSAPFNQAQYQALGLGLKASNPDAQQLAPIFTGSWEDAQLANQAAQDQISLGAKLIVTAAEGYTPGVIAAAKAAGIATLGAANASSADAAQVNIGLPTIDWTPTIAEIVDGLAKGEFGNKSYTSTIANKGLVFRDINHPAAAPQLPSDLEQQINELANKIASGQVTLPPLG